MTSHYIVIQYVHDPIQDERVNIGVVTYDDKTILWRFLTNWNRAEAFTGIDMEYVKHFANNFGRLSRAQVLSETMWRDGSIQFTAPRGSLVDARYLLETIAKRFLVEIESLGNQTQKGTQC